MQTHPLGCRVPVETLQNNPQRSYFHLPPWVLLLSNLPKYIPYLFAAKLSFNFVFFCFLFFGRGKVALS
jgi:hypothetical protein